MPKTPVSVAEYLAQLPDDRRRDIEAVRRVILENLDPDYEEGMQYGMIGYYVPHRVYPAGYHCDPRQPLPFACLASRKSHMTVGLMSLYNSTAEDDRFRKEWTKRGKKLDMGKSCIRFRKLDDLALDLLAEAIRKCPARDHIARYEAGRDQHQSRPKAVPARKVAGATPTRRGSKTRSTGKAAARKAARPKVRSR